MSYADLVRDALARVREVSVAEARRRLDAGDDVVFLDVREGEETAGGTVPGAVCIPRGLLEFRVEKRIPSRDAEIVCLCAAGGRSALSADALRKMGYGRVSSLAGGFTAWAEGGNPVAAPTA